MDDSRSTVAMDEICYISILDTIKIFKKYCQGECVLTEWSAAMLGSPALDVSTLVTTFLLHRGDTAETGSR